MSDLGSNELELSLIETLTASDLATLPADAFDALSGLPIGATLQKLWSGVQGVRDFYYARKIVRFLTQLGDIPAAERQEQISKMLVVPGERERFAEHLLMMLERLDDSRKSTILGRLCVGVLEGDVPMMEFRRMARAVEHISLDEEWPILQIIEEYKATYYPDGRHPEQWRHDDVLRNLVNERLHRDISDGDLRTIVFNLSQSGLFGCFSWRNGPPHDCQLAPWYFKLKPYMQW